MGGGGGARARVGPYLTSRYRIPKSASDFPFILCLSNASDTLKVQTD